MDSELGELVSRLVLAVILLGAALHMLRMARDLDALHESERGPDLQRDTGEEQEATENQGVPRSNA